MHPRQKFVRRHQHDLTSAQVGTPADFASQRYSWIGRRCCTRSFLLESYSLLQLVRLFFTCCLWSSFANVDVSHSVLFVLGFPDVTARCVCMPNRHLLISSIPGFHRHVPAHRSPRALFLSITRSVSAILSLYAFILALPLKVLNDRSDSLSAFIVMWLCRSSMRCKRCTSWTTSRLCMRFNVRRQDVESFNLLRSFNHNPWQWGVPLLLCQL